MSNQISLRIHSVKCVDETGGKWAEKVGNDEILLAGYGIDGNLNAKFVQSFEVYAHFDDGDVKRFSPPRKFVTLPLNEGGSFPKTCFVVFLLAEKDRGDFPGKATQVYNKLVEEIAKKKAEMLGARSASGVGEEFLKKIAEMVLKDLYEWVKSKIISAANDDIFPMRYTQVSISNPDFTWNGSKTSPPSAIEFRGHDGVYLMTYDWELA